MEAVVLQVVPHVLAEVAEEGNGMTFQCRYDLEESDLEESEENEYSFIN